MTLRPFTEVTGAAAPLIRDNVDTDVIIRIEHLTRFSRTGLGRHALAALRYLPDGSENPDFALNRAPFRNAPILLAGANFGCGSSREQAVWALQDMGLRCIIAPSFGDIFHSNCFQNGLLPVRLPLDEVQRILEQCEDGAPLCVDLETCVITTPRKQRIEFSIDARRREMLLSGLDEIGLTLKDDQIIRQWQDRDRAARPWAWPAQGTQ